MKQFYLYKIVSSINGKLYIGITCNPEQRWKAHQYPSSNCTKLKRAFAKYGLDNFYMEIICIGSEEYILELEVKAIAAYDTTRVGYNTLHGGNRDGVSLSEDVRGKISEGLKRYYETNQSSLKGSTVKERKDDAPLCAFGFWFPNVRTAAEALGINKKTIYARRKEGILHLEARPLKTKQRPKRNSVEDKQKRSESMLGKNSGKENGMFGKRNTSRSRAVIVEGVVYPSISEAVRLTIYTKSQIEKRLKKGDPHFSYLEVK